MRRWFVVLAVLSCIPSVAAQEVRIGGKGPRPCTAQEIIAREAELPAALPMEQAEIAAMVSDVLGCNARPALSRARTVDYRSNDPLSAIVDDRKPVTFQSQPGNAEIWLEGKRVGVTVRGFKLRNSYSRAALLKKDGFEDCSAEDWTEVAATDGSVTVSCQLSPLSKSSRLAFYQGVDLYGSDIARIRTESIEQCVAACLAEQQCRALTLNTDARLTRGPNCFLKGDRGRSESYDQAISVILLMEGEDEAITVDSQPVQPTEVRASN